MDYRKGKNINGEDPPKTIGLKTASFNENVQTLQHPHTLLDNL